MNILEYAKYKKMFGGSGGSVSGAAAYHLSSADDLPANAVDGSLALVKPTGMLGTWKPKETLNLDSLGTLEAATDYFEFTNTIYSSYGTRFIECIVDPNYGLCMSDSGGFYIEYQFDNWENFDLCDRTFHIFTEPTNATVISFFKENFKQCVTLYSRENGEWVNKGEI